MIFYNFVIHCLQPNKNYFIWQTSINFLIIVFFFCLSLKCTPIDANRWLITFILNLLVNIKFPGIKYHFSTDRHKCERMVISHIVFFIYNYDLGISKQNRLFFSMMSVCQFIACHPFVSMSDSKKSNKLNETNFDI